MIDSRYMVTRQRAKVEALKDEISSLHSSEPVEHEFGGVFGAFIMYFAVPIGALLMLLVSIKADWSVSKVSSKLIMFPPLIFVPFIIIVRLLV